MIKKYWRAIKNNANSCCFEINTENIKTFFLISLPAYEKEKICPNLYWADFSILY